MGIHEKKVKGPDNGYRRLFGASMLRGVKGSGGACPITEDRRARPPDHVTDESCSFMHVPWANSLKDSRPATT